MTKENRQVIGKHSSRYMQNRKKTGLFAFYELTKSIQKRKSTKGGSIILTKSIKFKH
jgi:hypothetical protein